MTTTGTTTLASAAVWMNKPRNALPSPAGRHPYDAADGVAQRSEPTFGCRARRPRLVARHQPEGNPVAAEHDRCIRATQREPAPHTRARTHTEALAQCTNFYGGSAVGVQRILPFSLRLRIGGRASRMGCAASVHNAMGKEPAGEGKQRTHPRIALHAACDTRS
eukprot:SAG11_NODE_1916_length_4071_cov_3.418429_7_plen_164_part_00